MLNFSIGSSFGSISGIITGLGLILGMYGADLSINSIIISLVSVALSDSISDALGIYYGVEAQNIFRINNSKTNQNLENNVENKDSIRQAQLAFIAKLVLPLLMIIPFVLLESKKNAVISNIIFGTIVIYYVSSKIFKSRTNIYQNIIITWLAILVTYLIGIQLKA